MGECARVIEQALRMEDGKVTYLRHHVLHTYLDAFRPALVILCGCLLCLLSRSAVLLPSVALGLPKPRLCFPFYDAADLC